MKKNSFLTDLLEENNLKIISIPEAVDIIKKKGKNFFSVAFTKRSDNHLRIMNCRTGVSKGVKGTGKKKKDNSLITVYDVNKKNYRNINVSGLRALRIKGENFIVGL